MSTSKREQRAKTIDEIRERVPKRLRVIEEMVKQFPDDANLGTWKALDTTVSRALIDVTDYIKRDSQRREGRR